MEGIYISGFADEIGGNFRHQLSVVTALGMEYISLRDADGTGIGDYTLEGVQQKLLPQLRDGGVKISSLGSPIGKISVTDDAAFVRQLSQLATLCQICNLLQCRYIRIFSFYLPQGEDPETYRDVVLAKLLRFEGIARQYGVVLLHENEKEIYGDTGPRCAKLFEAIESPYFKAVFDFANFVQCGEDPAVCWDLLCRHVRYIHIKDAVSDHSENVLCGTGEGRIKELLRRAILEEGYRGFLTLEPHLVRFDSLQSLEQKAATDIIRSNKAKDGAEGYAMQYHALQSILAEISSEERE